MTRVQRLIARLPVGATTVAVLAAALALWSLYPRPAADADQPPQAVRGDLQLALDRLQVRLTGEQIADAVSVRQPGVPAHRLVVDRIEGAVADMAGEPSAVRLWLADRLFVRDAKPAAVESLVLFHERTGDLAEAVGQGTSAPVRNDWLGSSWYTSETQVATLATDDERRWVLRGTTPIYDKRGLAVAMAEVRVETPRRAPVPVWPRNVALALMAAALAALWESRLALVRVALNDVFGLHLSARVLDTGETITADQRQVRDEINELASQAEAGNRLWLVRPGHDPTAPEPLFQENRGLELPEVRTCREPATASRRPSPPPSPQTAAGGETVVAAAIEDEHLLRRLLEVLLPHMDSAAAPASSPMADLKHLSLRVVIEIRRRESPAEPRSAQDADASRPRDTSDT
ncbi:MAG TPA: hypothetical protein PLP01_01765 [Phycisphaerae bacterium]|nr:hypothetical protein [Phycisphaerae bacterium]